MGNGAYAYDADEIRSWRVDRSGTVTSYGRRDGTIDEVLAEVVAAHEDGMGYTTRLADDEGNTIIELYSNGTPQLGAAIRNDYVVLGEITRQEGGARKCRRWRIFKAL